MIKNLYPPVNYSPGQELAPSPPWRVASGYSSLISRRFFINQNPCEGIDQGIATKYCFKYRAKGFYIPNLILILLSSDCKTAVSFS